jgi:hypothetical protein
MPRFFRERETDMGLLSHLYDDAETRIYKNVDNMAFCCFVVPRQEPPKSSFFFVRSWESVTDNFLGPAQPYQVIVLRVLFGNWETHGFPNLPPRETSRFPDPFLRREPKSLRSLCSRQESNLHYILRKDASYPLNDESVLFRLL